MGQLLLNIEDDILIPFRKQNHGRMSKIVRDFIRGYMQISKSSELLIQERKELLDAQKREFQELAAEIQREETALKLQEEEHMIKVKERDVHTAQTKNDVKDTIAFAASQGKLADLHLEAGQAGFETVEEYLTKKYEAAKNG